MSVGAWDRDRGARMRLDGAKAWPADSVRQRDTIPRGAWRNGSRRRLKIFCPKGRAGSSPAAPTILDGRALTFGFDLLAETSSLTHVLWTNRPARFIVVRHVRVARVHRVPDPADLRPGAVPRALVRHPHGHRHRGRPLVCPSPGASRGLARGRHHRPLPRGDDVVRGQALPTRLAMGPPEADHD